MLEYYEPRLNLSSPEPINVMCVIVSLRDLVEGEILRAAFYDVAKACTMARGQLMLQAQPENSLWEIKQRKRMPAAPSPAVPQASICVSYPKNRSFGPLDPYIQEIYIVTSLSIITDVLCEVTYRCDFSYLRKALAAAGLEDTLSVTEGMEDGLVWRIVFTEAQRDAFVYDGSFAASLAAFEHTTAAKLLMAFGAADPWFSLRFPETDHPNAAVFIHPTADHGANITTMPEEMKNEAIALIHNWLQ